VRHADHERGDVKTEHLTDQRYALNLYGAGLVYHSAPFGADTEIAGYVKLTAWIALDVPDTDFHVILYEILPDGRSVKLTEDMQRARFRESLRAETLVTPGEINEYTFDGFFWFARQVAAGSRLRLVIRAPNTIYLQKNYNSGGVVAEETAADARTAHVTLYHNAAHPSVLTLPVVG
jgi:putative CocE/NonD family hydrolase